MRAPLLVPALVLLASMLAACAGAPATESQLPFDPGSGRADWWVDPGQLPLDPATHAVRGFLQERTCASGTSPEGRITGPRIEYQAAAIIITYRIREIGGTCQSNPRFAITVELSQVLGSRRLLDGGVDPPRDATVDPTVVVEPTEDCGPLVGTSDTKIACMALIASTLGDRYTEFATVAVEPLNAACGGDTCLSEEAIETRSWKVTATDLVGARSEWICTYHAQTATCSART